MGAVSTRADKAAQLLSLPTSQLLDALKSEGIEDDENGLATLDSPQVSVDDIVGILVSAGAKKLPAKAAAGILKSGEATKAPETVPVPEKAPAVADIGRTLEQLTRSLKPIGSMSDAELLDEYIRTRDYEMEQELHKRAKFQPFCLLLPGKQEPGKEQIDVAPTLELLKSARKRTNPTFLPHGDTVVPVYRITELNVADRIIEYCPFCGEQRTLYKGYCEHCQTNFSDMGDDERAYLAMIAQADNFNVESVSDRKYAHASAVKGLEDLKKTWPSLSQVFEEKKATGNLPRLRTIAPRPNTQVADPFHVSGNRSF